MSVLRHRRHRHGDQPDDDRGTAEWVHGLHTAAAEPPPELWPDRQIRHTLGLLLARAGHPDAVARATVVLTAAPGAPEAEWRYGLRAWPASSPRCEDCGDHHGPAAVCRECAAGWNITAEAPLYDHRPGGTDPGPPLAGLCFGCAMASAALPEPRPALTTAGPPCAGDDPGGDPGPRALAAGVVPDPAYQAMFAEAEAAAAGAGPAGDAAASEPGPAPPAARAASDGTARKPRRRPARPPAPPAPGG